MSKSYVIIGAYGQLGLALHAEYPDAVAVDRDKLDITDMDSLQGFDWNGVDAIINAAAYTNVDGAETPDGRVLSWRINAVGVRNLAEIATLHDLRLIHISSDYVFDGSKENHLEDEPFSPLSVYGANKAAGDIAVSLVPKHYILRTSWVVGDGNNFVKTMFGLAQKGVQPSVVNDQFGRLTFTSELVRAIDHLLQTDSPNGVYNVTDSGPIKSWFDIAADVYELAGYNRSSVTGVTTAEYYAGKEFIAPRPKHSDLNMTKIQKTGFVSQDYETVLKEYVNKLKEDSVR